MIFLSSEDDVEYNFILVEQTICFYQEEDDEDICREPAFIGMIMPFDIPAMPLCFFHAYTFRDWTMEDTLREFVNVMTEEESLQMLREELDDDCEE